MAAKTGAGPGARGGETFKDKEKPTEVRLSNITAAKGQWNAFFCNEGTLPMTCNPKMCCVVQQILWYTIHQFLQLSLSPIRIPHTEVYVRLVLSSQFRVMLRNPTYGWGCTVKD